MKFYNPFKWHVIEKDGLFWIRKLESAEWAYMPTNDSVWLWSTVHPDCAFHSLESAKERQGEYLNQIKEYKDKQKIKVHV